MTQFLGNAKLIAAALWIAIFSAPGVLLWASHLGLTKLVVGERRHSALYVYFELGAWGKCEFFWHIPAPPVRWAVPR